MLRATVCGGCGGSLDQQTPGCRYCYKRHWTRRDRHRDVIPLSGYTSVRKEAKPPRKLCDHTGCLDNATAAAWFGKPRLPLEPVYYCGHHLDVASNLFYIEHVATAEETLSDYEAA